jgi:kynurenine formamidase
MTPADRQPELPSNRGRWGPEDELGTLNLITDDVRARAVAEARTGRRVSLAHPREHAPLAAGPFAMATTVDPMTAAVQTAMFTGPADSPVRALAEMLQFVTHSGTHLDALSHIVVDGEVYPGRPVQECMSIAGVTRGSTAVFGQGIVTRGVLLDFAADGPRAPDAHIDGADLDAAAEQAGVEVLPGDALIVRGDWDLSRREKQVPGISLDAVRWMHRHDIALYVGDIGDARPPIDPRIGGALHRVALPYLGLPLLDAAELTPLAKTCRAEGRQSFLFIAAPMRLTAASGVPVNPLAIF